MQIIDNRVGKTEQPLKPGDIIVGKFSSDYYVVTDNVESAINLRNLVISRVSILIYERTNMNMFESKTTLTFEGEK